MRISRLQSPLRTILFAAFLYLFGPTPAQAQAPYLYASIPGAGATSQVAGFSVALDGTLTAVPGSPFNLSSEGGFVTTDPLDQFLFVLNPTTNSISVLSINPNTGALAEVSGSPVPAPTAAPGSGGLTPSSPICMATFAGKSGNYLFVAYRNTTPAASQFNGAIVAFRIGTTSPALTPTAQTNFEASPIDIVTSPLVNGPQGYLYAVLQSAAGDFSGVGVFTIDPGSGALNPESSLGGIHFNEQSLAINSKGTFLFDGWGNTSGGIESSAVLSDGSLSSSPAGIVSLQESNSPPSAMLIDGSGRLLYVEEHGQLAGNIVDPTTSALTPSSSPPTQSPLVLTLGNTAADPSQPFLYTLQSGQVQVFAISDITTGALIKLLGSTIQVGGAENLTLTHNAAARSSTPLAALLNPPMIKFDETSIGQTTAGTSASLTNIGTQSLDITSISLTDQINFSETSNCQTQLAPGSSCTITLTFEPTVSGVLNATIAVLDAAGIQTMSLTGIGQDASSGGSGSGGPGGAGSGGSGTGSGGTGTNGSGSGGPGGSSGSGSGSGGSGTGSGGSGAGGSPSPTPQPAISFSSTSLSFNATALNATTPVQNIAITSAAASSLNITGIALSGANTSDFKVTSDCSTSSPYPQYQGCSLTVAFTPSASGSRFAQVLVTDSAPNSPQTISLSGMTQAEALTISPDTSASGQSYQESISAGQTALFKLQLVSTFNGTVSFSSCSGAPSGMTCSVPAAISVIANQVMPFSISVAPAVSTSVSRFDRPDAHSPTAIPTAQFGQAPGAMAINLALAIVLVAAIAITLLRALTLDPILKSSRTLSLPASAIILALLALTPFVIAGCGGASTIATAPTVTPTPDSQTYTITITPTATTSANLPVPNVQPITLTLIID